MLGVESTRELDELTLFHEDQARRTSRFRGRVWFLSFATAVGSVGLSGWSGATTAHASITRPAALIAVSHANGSGTTVTIAPETPTPGDIPDTVAYIRYRNLAGHYSFTHPEGWAQTARATQVAFSDKYNGVAADSKLATARPTPATARATDIPKLKTAEPAFVLRSVSAVTLPAGSGVLIVYRRNSPPDQVTGKSIRQEVNRYRIFSKGRVVTVELFGAVGADNVDPYAKMSRSLTIS
jgi:hypothetical protein